MNENYKEIPCNKIKNLTDSITKKVTSYRVKYFGISGQVFEEHRIPIPDKKIIRTFKEDGTEDIAKQVEIDISKEES